MHIHGRIAGSRLGVVDVRVVHRRQRIEVLVSVLCGEVAIKTIRQDKEVAHVSVSVDARVSGGLERDVAVERTIGRCLLGVEFGERNAADAIDLVGHPSVHPPRRLYAQGESHRLTQGEGIGYKTHILIIGIHIAVVLQSVHDARAFLAE